MAAQVSTADGTDKQDVPPSCEKFRLDGKCFEPGVRKTLNAKGAKLEDAKSAKEFLLRALCVLLFASSSV
jgi:hypothetical protein